MSAAKLNQATFTPLANLGRQTPPLDPPVLAAPAALGDPPAPPLASEEPAVPGNAPAAEAPPLLLEPALVPEPALATDVLPPLLVLPAEAALGVAGLPSSAPLQAASDNAPRAATHDEISG